MGWDPDQYLRFESERGLPFRHLVAPIVHLDPSAVIDLGCGPGRLTTGLFECWPDCLLDSDPDSELARWITREDDRG